jgi:group I intron endonuclease
MKTGIIYLIKNKITNKVYIGKTIQDINRRFNCHINRAINDTTNNYLYSSIRKYGKENFTIEPIDEANTIIELNEKEIYWIKHYNSNNKEFGYNRTLGGEGGDTWSLNQHKEITSKRLSDSIRNSEKHKKATSSEAFKAKLRKVLSPIWKSKEYREKLSLSKLGDLNPTKRPDVRLKMSLARKGMKLTEEHKLNIRNSSRKRFLDNPQLAIDISNRNRGMKSKRKGKTLIELYGIEKANEWKQRMIKSRLGKKRSKYNLLKIIPT